jgi:Holliday junction DNA helicase RuvB
MSKSLRPDSFDEYIGQQDTITELKTYVQATKVRNSQNEHHTALPHLVFEGSAGLGKTSIAFVVAKELNANIKVMQANAIEKLGDLVANLVCLEDGDILFLDEIHSLKPQFEEMLYSVMEDFRLDVMIAESNGGSKPLNLDLPQFTLIGATTEIGRLKKPLRDRFIHQFTLRPYSTDDLKTILQLNAPKTDCSLTDDAAIQLAQASKGTPRIALSYLRKCADWALVENDSVIDPSIVQRAFQTAKISEQGLSSNDIRFLKVLASKSRPTGIKSLSDITGIDSTTIERSIEPYLHEQGFMEKLPRGRVITELGRQTLEAELSKQ